MNKGWTEEMHHAHALLEGFSPWMAQRLEERLEELLTRIAVPTCLASGVLVEDLKEAANRLEGQLFEMPVSAKDDRMATAELVGRLRKHATDLW
jgi:hypothetical protein